MSCNQVNFDGLGECMALMAKMNGMALQKKGNTWTDTTIESATTWQTNIAVLAEANRNTKMFPILNFENTTDDIEIVTTPLGKKVASGKPIPSGVIYLDMSLCDYKHIHDWEDTSFEFIPFFQDGSMWMSRKADGTLKGFRCQLATKAGLPPEDKMMSYPMYLFFDNYSEFKDVVLVKPDFTFTDILDYSPVGLEMLITTAYAASEVTVKVRKRGSGDPMTGLIAADFITVDQKVSLTPAGVVSLVDNGQGSYTLTLQKDTGGTPATMVTGEWCKIIVHDDDATNLTYLSHDLKVTI